MLSLNYRLVHWVIHMSTPSKELHLSTPSLLSQASQKLVSDQRAYALHDEQQQSVKGLCFPLILQANEQKLLDRQACFEWFAEFGDTP